METMSTTEGGAKIVGKPSRHLFDHEGPGPRIMAADSLDSERVCNTAGEDLGTVEHIMLDVPNGKIAYAVLSFGGFLGLGDKLFAVPWQSLALDIGKKCFILNVSKERLKAAPGFDKDNWPTFADQQWARDLHTFYDSTPYWEL